MQTTEIILGARWKIDAGHSSIGFKVKHLMVANVRGEFKEYAATIHTRGDDFLNVEIDCRINPASLDTGDVARDAHMKGPGFFNVEVFKEINFCASAIEKTGNEMYLLYGDLTMKGIKNKIRLEVEFDGMTTSPQGHKKAYFRVIGKINRKDWGLNWSAVIESGGAVVGEDVLINCELELVKQSDQ